MLKVGFTGLGTCSKVKKVILNKIKFEFYETET